MVRAKTPLDEIAASPMLAENSSLPVTSQPWFQIGQCVAGYEFQSRYYLKQLIINGSKSHAKAVLNLLENGIDLECSIVGIQPRYFLPVGMVCNQAYLARGQSWSGPSWHYQVLIKGVLKGRNVCVVPRVWLREDGFTPASEQSFYHGYFYCDSWSNNVYKCVVKQDVPWFVYVGHIRSSGELGWDNHITPQKLTYWMRRNFELYEISDSAQRC